MIKAQQEVLSLLMMRFGLDPYGAIPVTKRWLEQNPERNWHNLKEQLLKGQVTFKKGRLRKIKPSEIIELISRMKDEDRGIKLKNRWYNFKFYRETFTGSEIVKWLMETEKINRQEAIILGQILIDRQILHQIQAEHTFSDGKNLLYRFASEDIEVRELSSERGFDWGDMLPIE